MRRLFFPVAVALIAAAMAGCSRIPVAEQGLVSKPNMVFAETVVFSDKSVLQSQVEPGAAATGGAQAAGCTSCK